VKKSSKQELKTKKAYNARPDVMKRRVAQNKARRQAIKAGKAKVGDGKHVDHIKPLKAGGSTKKSNTRVISASKNQGWRGRQPGMYTKKK
jgi:predicted transcriptional regulator